MREHSSFRHTAVIACLTMATICRGQAPADPETRRAFAIRAGSVEDLRLPTGEWRRFETTLVLGGARRTLDLTPHDVRSPSFALLVADASGMRRVAAPPPTTYRGYVRGEVGSQVAASLIRGGLSATISFSGSFAGGATWIVQPLTAIDSRAPRARHVVYRAIDSLASDHTCGLQNQLAPAAVDKPGGSVGPAANRLAEIAIDADNAYYQRNGSNVTNTTDDITKIINAVAAIYERDTQIEYKITQIVIRTSPNSSYTSNDPLTLLQQFRSFWNTNHLSIQRDLAHLFTGRDLNGSVVGVAWLGVVCTTSAYGLSQSQYTTNLARRVGLTAHEIGHNWDADHCSGSGCFIMCPTINGCGQDVTKFSPGSISKIVAHRTSRGCLSNAPPKAPPKLSSLSPSSIQALRGAKVVLTGTNLEQANKVTVDGQEVDSRVWNVVNDTSIEILEPPSAKRLGAVPVVVSNDKGPSNAISLSYTEVKPPQLFAFTTWLVNFGLPYDFAGSPNGVWAVLVSPDNKTFKLMGQDILQNLVVLRAGVLNPAGVGSTSLVAPSSLKNATIYGQVAIFPVPSGPLGVTNIIGTQFF